MLLLFASERAELMRLGKPQLTPIVSRDSIDLYKALGVVRRAVIRLWRATSEVEILHVAGEEARQLLPSFELIFVRRTTARKEAQFPQLEGSSTARLAEARSYALLQVTAEQLARHGTLWQRTAAAGLLTSESYPQGWNQLYRVALHEHGIDWGNDWDSPLAAHIRGSSASAVVGGTSTRPHDVSELERAMLSTIADFASLVLQ
jgi:hypothetical protein